MNSCPWNHIQIISNMFAKEFCLFNYLCPLFHILSLCFYDMRENILSNLHDLPVKLSMKLVIKTVFCLKE